MEMEKKSMTTLIKLDAILAEMEYRHAMDMIHKNTYDKLYKTYFDLLTDMYLNGFIPDEFWEQISYTDAKFNCTYDWEMEMYLYCIGDDEQF